MGRHELTDDQWARFVPLVPPVDSATGRPRHDHCTVVNGILTTDNRNWLTTHGATLVIPCRDMESGPKNYNRNAYRERPIVDRTINQIRLYRRIATHYKKVAAYL